MAFTYGLTFSWPSLPGLLFFSFCAMYLLPTGQCISSVKLFQSSYPHDKGLTRGSSKSLGYDQSCAINVGLGS